LLEIFEEFEVAATWAVVGCLFAESRTDLERSRPGTRPVYLDPTLSSYEEEVGEDEDEDPLHFAPTLIRAIRESPRQEIATHTFSHYYCLERGQDRETFSADLHAARVIAERSGIEFRSIVFPRNQHNPDYDDLLLAQGITSYRGNPHHWAWRFEDARESRRLGKRALRLFDAYLPATGSGTISWESILQQSGLCDIRATRQLTPYRPSFKHLEDRRIQRIRDAIRHAARSGEIFHIWWHPHNFGVYPEQNMSLLRRVLEGVAQCKDEYGLQSLSMAGLDDMVRRRPALCAEGLSSAS
jgi:hypothetical protein